MVVKSPAGQQKSLFLYYFYLYCEFVFQNINFAPF